jgi:heme-degrading monooxygenase HmoA
MIIRIWHGWTRPENAEAYEELLGRELFVNIVDRNIGGFRGIKLLRRRLETEVEFVTIMEFNSLDAVKEFAGSDYEHAVVPPGARALLSRYDRQSLHYELVTELPG